VVAAGPGLLPRLWLGKRVACAVSSFGGTWAEYLTHATLCVPLRNNLSLEQGAMLLVNPMTALAFFDIVKRGKHAAITSTAAASALGRMIVRLSQRHRVPVIAVVLSLVLCRMRVCFSVLRFHCRAEPFAAPLGNKGISIFSTYYWANSKVLRTAL